MGLRCGIVGLPNVGKTTIFNTLTAADARVENYEFCTIDPNEGVVYVPDGRLRKLGEMVAHEKIRRTTLEFLDVAGLVEGAAKYGRGRGAEFLGHIRDTDAVIHVLRLFEDPDVIASHASLDPVRDAEIVNLELVCADLGTVAKRMEKSAKPARVGDKKAAAEIALLKNVFEHLDKGFPAMTLPAAAKEETAHLGLLSAKPMVYVGNISENQLSDSQAMESLWEFAKKNSSPCIFICGKMEAEIALLENENERKAFLAEMALQESGLDKLVRTAYDALDLITFYTIVGREIGSWTIKRGTKASRAAGKIHTDMERGFIRAEIIGYDDFVRCTGEVSAREMGMIRIEGRDYVMKDGDVTRFRFNV